jgi:hypothetical protein
MKQHTLRCLLWIIFFLLTSACGGAVESAPTASQTLLPLRMTPSATQGRLSQPARKPTATPWLSTTIPATSTFTPMPPTWTPLPTLPPDEAQALVIELLDTNAGCRLPCWWGITPGQISWQEALSFIESFALYISVYPGQDGMYADVHFPLPREVPYAYRLQQHYMIQEGIVEEIEVYNYDFAPHTYLPEFLSTYGQPNEVWVRTYRLERGNEPFEFALFYPSQGTLMNTPGGGGGGIEGDIIRNCLRDMNWPFLYLWSPEIEITFKDAEEKYLDPDEGYFLPLYDATGMTVAEFFENFKDPNTTACLETPLDLWP